jgi:hypothetical protein
MEDNLNEFEEQLAEKRTFWDKVHVFCEFFESKRFIRLLLIGYWILAVFHYFFNN